MKGHFCPGNFKIFVAVVYFEFFSHKAQQGSQLIMISQLQLYSTSYPIYCLRNVVDHTTKEPHLLLPLVTEEPSVLSFPSRGKKSCSKDKGPQLQRWVPLSALTHYSSNTEHLSGVHHLLGTPPSTTHAWPHLFHPTILTGGFYNYLQHIREETTWKG